MFCTCQRHSEKQRLRFADIDVCQPFALHSKVWTQRPRQVRHVRVNAPKIINRKPKVPLSNVLDGDLVRRVEGFAEVDHRVYFDFLKVPPEVFADRGIDQRFVAIDSMPRFTATRCTPLADVRRNPELAISRRTNRARS